MNETMQPTDRSGGSRSPLQQYLNEIGEVQLLTPTEEAALSKRIQGGDESAREHLIRANLRLVVKIAREYENCGVPLLDLINEGNMGLMKAADRFDPEKGAKFSSYGSYWIKQSMRKALADQSKTVRVPIQMVDRMYNLRCAEEKLAMELGREPSDEELAAATQLSSLQIRRARQAKRDTSSLDAQLGDDDSSTLGEIISDDRVSHPAANLQMNQDLGVLKALLPELPEREQKILRLRFGIDRGEEMTLEEIGQEFGLTRERIRQLQNQGLRTLKRLMVEAGLQPEEEEIQDLSCPC